MIPVRVAVLRMVLFLALVIEPASGQDGDLVGDLAQRVAAAAKAGDAVLLGTLAADRRVDPWLVVARLADGADFESADRFVAALPAAGDSKGLAAYVAGRRGGGPDPLAPILALDSAARGSSQAGDHVAAIVRYAAAADSAEALGWLKGASSFCFRAGNAARLALAYDRALLLWERRLALERRRGDGATTFSALLNLGSLCGSVGDYDGALGHFSEALALARERHDVPQETQLLQNMAIVDARRGRFAAALDRIEQALDLGGATSPLRTELLLQLAEGRSAVGEHEQALRAVDEARGLFDARRDATGIGRCLGVTSSIHREAQRYDLMLESARRAVAHFRSTSQAAERLYLAVGLENVGVALTYLRRFDEAIAALNEALAIFTELQESARRIEAKLDLAFASLGTGDLATAESEYAAALEVGTRQASPRLGAAACWGLARVRLAQQRLDDAAREADAAMSEVEIQSSGLAEGQGVFVRNEHQQLFRLAVEIAVLQGRPADVFAAIERGRAMALLESLDAREGIRSARVPADLRAAEDRARIAARQAQLRYEAALATGELELVRTRRKELDAARSGIEEVVGRIQRGGLAGVEALYPRPVALTDAQRLLGSRTALLIYTVLDDEVVAVVVTAESARVARVGSKAEVVAVCAAIVADPGAASEQGARLIEPLALEATVEQVLVSPDGCLFQVPFALLLPRRDVAYVPSATTYARLRADGAARGDGVLAVGDPAYGPQAGLVRLPATADEVRAVGTVALLQRDATIASFDAALATRPRWRAVHFACHGVIDPSRPLRSALALTPTDVSDGLLTGLDVCERSVPTDLAVLSACETGRGRAYAAEGMVGLTRAFVIAGAPRVVVSLWKVDDAATLALMKKFHELWNPKDGHGLATAAALRGAQQFVRAQEKWKDPRFWAAWMLWGLPD